MKMFDQSFLNRKISRQEFLKVSTSFLALVLLAGMPKKLAFAAEKKKFFIPLRFFNLAEIYRQHNLVG